MTSPGSIQSRFVSVALCVVFAGACLCVFLLRKPPAAAVAAAAVSTGPPQPVLVELFTSEGCSSCPPADALLARLDATQFVPGAHAIVLSEHVTYWNHLGWSDPFSMDAVTDRQQQYATRFHLQSVYTPQAVVDGATEVEGSDSDALARAIAKAAEKPKPEISIDSVTWQEDTLHFSVHAAMPEHTLLMAALAEDATLSSVTRGENAGRTLHHVAVVRVLKQMDGSLADGRPLSLRFAGDKTNGEQGKTLRLVVFLADHRSGRVEAIAEAPVAR